jgi:hypothetical protein
MPFHVENKACVWYGHMIFPPAQVQSDIASMSYGEVQSKMIKSSALDSYSRTEAVAS